jgi:hypothetical protein
LFISNSPEIVSFIKQAGWKVPPGSHLFFQITELVMLQDFINNFMKSLTISTQVVQPAVPQPASPQPSPLNKGY